MKRPFVILFAAAVLLATGCASTSNRESTGQYIDDSSITTRVKKAMADASQFVVIATDSSKLGTRSVARALPMTRIDLLVTELDPKDPKLDPFRDVTDIL